MQFQPRRPKNDEERILPLINVVFLLLIFFMLAGRLTTSDPFKIEPPSSANKHPAEESEVTVLIGADKRLALDGKVMNADALEKAVAKRIDSGESTVVRVKADGRAEGVQVVEVMERLRQAGVAKLRLLTVPSQ